LALRLCFIENRYRSQIDLTWDALIAADNTIKRWRMKLREWGPNKSTEAASSIIDSLKAHLFNDLGTVDVAVELRRIERDGSIANEIKAEVFRTMDRVFALDLDRAEKLRSISAEQESLLQRRAAARASKDFALSDELRDQLLAQKIVVKDSAAGQSYEIIP
jgi:cysteinyl-tRNA synthetase